MGARVTNRIGDIYCVNFQALTIFGIRLRKGYKRYFQYITKDSRCLNGRVIRVFKRKYPLNYVMNIEEILTDKVDFYAHTMISIGVKANAWQKVGKSKDVGDYDHVLFRTLDFFGNGWNIWPINGEYETVKRLTFKLQKKTYPGFIFPYPDIIYRMKYGWYPGTMRL